MMAAVRILELLGVLIKYMLIAALLLIIAISITTAVEEIWKRRRKRK